MNAVVVDGLKQIQKKRKKEKITHPPIDDVHPTVENRASTVYLQPPVDSLLRLPPVASVLRGLPAIASGPAPPRANPPASQRFPVTPPSFAGPTAILRRPWQTASPPPRPPLSGRPASPELLSKAGENKSPKQRPRSLTSLAVDSGV